MFIDVGHPVASNTVLETHGGLDIVEVSGIPAQMVEHDLKCYFETQTKCGEGDEAVKEIKIIRPGVAHIRFISPEGNKNYCILNFNLLYKHVTLYEKTKHNALGSDLR